MTEDGGMLPDFAQMRFIEIGRPWLKRILPEQTLCFSSELSAKRAGRLVLLRRALADSAIAVIVCHPTMFAPWDWRWVTRAVFNRRLLRTGLPVSTMFGPQFLRGGVSAPIAVVDFEDLPVINRCNLFLLDRATAYFKRELPTDRWKVFLKTDHHGVPTPRYRMRHRNRLRVEKVLPLSLGFNIDSAGHFSQPAEKTVDIFFAGRIEGSSTARERGLAELVALRERGVTIDMPDGPLPTEAFFKRAAAARLVWSPEGFGWDCFRHYEAAMCGSVPVINNPTIERHQPLIQGAHAIYYDIEQGGLTRAILAALADRDGIAAMARAAKAHVEAYHTPAAIARYVIETTLARAKISPHRGSQSR